MLAETVGLLRQEFVDAKSCDALMLAAIRGMLREIDPEGGEFFTPADLEALRRDEANEPGPGLELARRGEDLVVVPPLAGGPAEAAGVQPGDVLVAIGGEKTRGLSVRQATRLLRGPSGSEVALIVRRAGEERTFDLRRTVVLAKSATTLRRAGADVVVLRVPGFGPDIYETLPRLLREEWDRAPPSGVVLDLRRNTGGLLDAAVFVAAAFLPRDAVVASSVGRGTDASRVIKAAPAFYGSKTPDPLQGLPEQLKAVPLAVLVDEGTAAGAELVAAALKDHARAVLVGRRTFGRASIQTVLPISGGAVKYTSAYWRSPQGREIHRVGVQPDRVVQRGEEELAVELVMQPR